MKKVKMNLISVSCLSLLLLAACGGDEDTASDGNTDTNDNGNGTEQTDGGVLIFARGGDSQGLDPGAVTDGESSRVTKQIYETLIEFEQDSFELKEGLATNWELVKMD